jgi:apolipoprotein D and lipocalin family protein
MRKAAFVLALSSLLVACTDPPLDVAQGVKLERFQGRWYEIAKLRRPTQANCFGTVANYTLEGPDALKVVHECHEDSPDGPRKLSAARAVASDPSEPAKLSLDFGMAYGDYWILETGDKYEYAVIGHPSRRYLWILSRASTLPEAVLDGVLERSRAKGFPVDELDYTVQPN